MNSGKQQPGVRIRGNNMIMLGGRNEGNAAPVQAAAEEAPKTVQGNPKPANAPAKRNPQPAPAGFEGGGDDDLPF